MNSTPPFLILLLGFNVGILVLAMGASIFARFRRTLLESKAAPISSGSGTSLFVAMVLFHPKSWLVLGLLGYGGYVLVTERLSPTAIMFYWGIAAGAVALVAFALLVQRKRKRLASIKGNANSHVA